MGTKAAVLQFFQVHMAGHGGVLPHEVNGINLEKENIWLLRSYES